MAVREVEVSASFATELPAVFGETPFSVSFGLPSVFNEASVGVPPGESSPCHSIAVVGDAGFSASWPLASLVAPGLESGDAWLPLCSIFEAAVGAGVV